MLEEFKKFILKGDVVSLSTGVLIGAAFGKIVESFTKGIVEPIMKLFGGTPEFVLGLKISELKDKTTGLVTDNKLDLGMIINATLGFLITAAVIFFIIVKPYNALMARMVKAEPAPAPAGPSDEVKLLTEIRDALKR
jgi:large conductance mechanosensitive channel